ncbi:MAG: YbjN domain-containing protein [Candidatus Cloacimonetes bacterium]|nr:YbjN domain-containing protein [Candidatus Cloacimonadota bacterium]
MIKNTFLLMVLLLASFLLFSQEMVEEEVENEDGFNMGGSAGAVIMGGQTYSRIRLMPELTFGKFGIGLDIDILIDSNGDIREEDWDDAKDYLNKIYYVRYGLRGDPFFARIGGFPNYNLGPGLVMKNYSNMLRYPEFRQIGLQVGGKLPISEATLEAFSSNLNENEILAGRFTFQPLESTGFPLFNKIIFGGTVAMDRDQYGKLYDWDWNDGSLDIDGDGILDYDALLATGLTAEQIQTMIDNGYLVVDYDVNPEALIPEADPIAVAALDYELPLIETDLFKLSHYGEAAKIMDHNMGFIFPGFYSKFLIFHLNLEFRYYQEDFIPSYFDHLYDDQRSFVTRDSIGYNITTKENDIQNSFETKGWYGSIKANLFQFITLTVAYEDMYGANNTHRRSLWSTLALNKTFIPKLSTAQISYYQVGVDRIVNLKTPEAYIVGKVGYSMSPNTELVAKYQERYEDYNDDGEIKGIDETLKTFSVGVEFRF